MSSDQSYVDYVLEQAHFGRRLTTRKMFGEFALYLDDKVIAFVCDNQLFLKPTEEGRRVLGTVTEGAPYPQAKPHFKLDAELDDTAMLQRAFQATADALPLPKPKAAKKAAAKK